MFDVGDFCFFAVSHCACVPGGGVYSGFGLPLHYVGPDSVNEMRSGLKLADNLSTHKNKIINFL